MLAALDSPTPGAVASAWTPQPVAIAVTVDEFVAVNLARDKMPRKSTWFTPKARAGLVVTATGV